MEAVSGLIHIFSSSCQLLLDTSIDSEKKKVVRLETLEDGIAKTVYQLFKRRQQEVCKGEEARKPPKQAQWEREADDKHDG